MTEEYPRRCKFTQFMSNHILSYEYRYKFLSIMYCEGISYQIRDYC